MFQPYGFVSYIISFIRIEFIKKVYVTDEAIQLKHCIALNYITNFINIYKLLLLLVKTLKVPEKSKSYFLCINLIFDYFFKHYQ